MCNYRIKLEHPTTLMTTPLVSSSSTANSNPTNNSPPTASRQTATSHNMNTPTLPIYNHYHQNRSTTPMTISASNSPATTPTFSTAHTKHVYSTYQPGEITSSSPPAATAQAQSSSNNLTNSTSSISLPSSSGISSGGVGNNSTTSTPSTAPPYHHGGIVQLNSNGQITYNRSFGDISEVMTNTTTSHSAMTPTTSLSPSASSATTPTCPANLPSSFFRVYIGTSTAVVEKKPVMLKDALSSKLKSRNMEVDKCIAFTKDSK